LGKSKFHQIFLLLGNFYNLSQKKQQGKAQVAVLVKDFLK
jgi:hypothetical protein